MQAVGSTARASEALLRYAETVGRNDRPRIRPQAAGGPPHQAPWTVQAQSHMPVFLSVPCRLDLFTGRQPGLLQSPRRCKRETRTASWACQSACSVNGHVEGLVGQMPYAASTSPMPTMLSPQTALPIGKGSRVQVGLRSSIAGASGVVPMKMTQVCGE